MDDIKITKENYIELGGVNCTECNAFLDWETVDDAMRKYGLIALTNDPGEIPHLYNPHWKISEDIYFFYLGFSCPKCKKTIFYNCDFIFGEKVFDGEIVKKRDPYAFLCPPNIYMYESNFSPTYENTIRCSMSFSKNFIYFDRTSENKLPFRIVKQRGELAQKVDKIYDDNGNDFVINCFPAICDKYAIGPSISIPLYFDNIQEHTKYIKDMDEEYFFGGTNFKNIIKKLQQIENDTGKKVFNRFVLYDPIYPHINQFCFQCSDRFGTMPFRVGFGKFQPGSALSYCEPDQYIITRNIRFLELLNFTDQSPEVIRDSHVRYSKEYFMSDISGSFLTKNFDRKIKPSEYESINSDIWKEFHKSYLQQLLSKMLNNFIEEYINISTKTNCTFESIWKLKDDYFIKIFDSVKSRTKRDKINKEQKIIQRKRIKEIELNYPTLGHIISDTDDICTLKEKISSLSKIHTIDSILLLGETGTGKELFAKAVHECSGRKGEFVPVNCASIPKDLFESEFFGHAKGAFTGATNDKTGFFEQADGGTIFLDEIGDMDINFQARLLRVLQEKEITPVGGKTNKIDFLLVSATHRSFREMIDNKLFREDLFQRINEFEIDIPPLRDRKGDIPVLMQHFINKYDDSISSDSGATPIEIDKDCIKLFEKRHWRGNVRELEKACKVMMAFRSKEDRSEINFSEFNLEDEEQVGSQKQKSTQTRIKKSKGPGNTKVTDDEVKQAMIENGYNKAAAARVLGVERITIDRRWKKINK